MKKVKNLTKGQKIVIGILVGLGLAVIIGGIVFYVVKVKGKNDRLATLPGQDLDENGCGVVYYNSPDDFVIAVANDAVPDDADVVVNLPATETPGAISYSAGTTEEVA